MGVLLNEPLVFYFSDELDPASVTPSTARVLDSSGRLVAGEFRAENNRLVFEPRLAKLQGLSDGGFRPSEHVTVELSGFPVPSGLRSLRGELLEASFTSAFDTIEKGVEGASFLDGTPDAAYPLLLESTTIGAQEAIGLICVEAVDPRSLNPGAFQLRRYQPGGAFEEIAVDVSLESNTMEAGARLVIRALQSRESGVPRRLEPGDYHLWIHEGADAPRDLGGHPMRSSWSPTQLPAVVTVELRPELAGNRSVRLDFLSMELASPAEVPGTDGTVRWSGTGGLGLWLPLAAGDGSAGEVAADATSIAAALAEAQGDLHAARLRLPVDEKLDLSARGGVVVLRSQTSMRIEGPLVRASQDASVGRLGGSSHLPGVRGDGVDSLDGWLAQQADEGRELTALVAGGDLWIDGDITVEGPLLLAAGGRLRVRGRIEAHEIWVVGVGGGVDLHPAARQSGLRMVPTALNRLQTPLRLGALSAPFRPESKAPNWSSATLGIAAGAGSARVRFLGERDLAGGGVETVGPVDDAAVLDRCGGIRIWIELEMRPGEPWDPPMVDFVDLRWTEETDL